MLGGVAGRHMSSRRRGSSPQVRARTAAAACAGALSPPSSPRPMRRRRAALAATDIKSCALIHTRLKLGDIICDSPARSNLVGSNVLGDNSFLSSSVRP